MPLPERLQVILELRGDQYKREAREVASATGNIRGQVDRTGSATGRLQNNVNQLGGSTKTLSTNLRGATRALGGLAAGAAITRGIRSAIDRAEEMNSVYAVTAQIIKQTGGAANITAEEIKELSRQQSILTGVDKALVTEANNVLLTFKNVRNEVGEGNDVFTRASNLVLDVATVMETNATGAAAQLAKALNDPISQLGALSRAGLTFTDTQEEQIKTLVHGGDILQAQKIILSELESQLGGTAEAAADDSDKIANAYAEIAEAGGMILLPYLRTLAIEAQAATGAMDELDRFAAITGQARDSGELLAGALVLIGNELDGQLAEWISVALGAGTFEEQARRLIETSGITATELRKVRDGLDVLVDEFALTEEQAEAVADMIDIRLASSLTDAEMRARQAAAAMGWYADQTGDAGDETDDTIPPLDSAADKYADLADEARDAASAVDDYITAQRGAVDPAIRAVKSLDAYQKALAESNAALDKFGPGSDEANQAGLRLLETYSNLIADAQDLADVTGISVERALRALGDQAGLTDDQLRFILDTLEEIDGFKAEAEIMANFQVKAARAGEQVTLPGGFEFRQHGGVTDRPFISGEAGRELVIPQRPVEVLNNATTERLLAALATGGRQPSPVNVNLQGTGDPIVDAQRVGATYSVLRRIETRR